MTRFLLLLVAIAAPSVAAAQATSVLRVTVQDETQYVLPHAIVTLTDAAGVEKQMLVSQQGVAEFRDLKPGPYLITVAAAGFHGYSGNFTVKRGTNNVVATMPVALAEEVTVSEQSPDTFREKGFTDTLSQNIIDSLSDDPDEMADQLMQMAGPGAQIFVDGFRGSRIPPKDQIQQIRLHTNSFAAEYHDVGQIRIEIVTKPGFGDWRGGANFGYRNTGLNAKNYFAPVRADEEMKRFSLNSQGPIQKGKTSITFNAEGNLSYDSATIVAQTPAGPYNNQARRPLDTMNLTTRVEQQLGGGNTLRGEYQRRDQTRKNNGVGDFDLPDRAYDSESVSDVLRVWNTKVFGKLFSETRFEFTRSSSTNTSYSSAPTVQVLGAFTSGGAGQTGTRIGNEFTLTQNFDRAIRKHQLRFGGEVNGGSWDSTTQSNANGTFTFSTLGAYEAGIPQTYTRRVGDPRVAYSNDNAGVYLQDDFRLTKNINVSLGARAEGQTHIDGRINVGPRASFAYLLGKGTVRGGYGMFFDWMDPNVYEQTLRVDGVHQIDETIINPSFPEVGTASGTALPPSRIQLGPSLTQPTIHQASIGYERPLGKIGQIRTDYMMLRGTSTLRSINVNAPINGARPDPALGNVTQIASTGRRDTDRVTVGLNLRVPQRNRPMGSVNYQWSSQRAYSDGALSLPADSNNPDADWGPTSQDVRHRLFGIFNSPIGLGVRAGFQVAWNSALPYNITTGLDNNGDTVFNDRPAGVTRNSARGARQWNGSLRINRSFNLGGLLSGPVQVGGGGGGNNSMQGPGPGGAGGGPGGGGMMIMDGGVSRYRIDFYVSATNLFNTVNFNQFIGNQLSPYFGTATSAAPPRKIEVGMSLSF